MLRFFLARGILLCFLEEVEHLAIFGGKNNLSSNLDVRHLNYTNAQFALNLLNAKKVYIYMIWFDVINEWRLSSLYD